MSNGSPWKQLLKELRRRVNIEYNLRFKGGYFGLNGLDRAIERYVDFDNGFFVEIGANDGITQSNTFHFEKKRGWRGVLVEPVPQKFFQCKLERSDKTKVYCNACVSFGYTEKYVDILYANLMSVGTPANMDRGTSAGHARKGTRFLAPHEAIVEFGALASTLDAILVSSDAPTHIDLFSLDVEGAELEVLKGIDHEKYRFRYIILETSHFDKLNDFLFNIGYNFVEKLSKHDYIFADIKTHYRTEGKKQN